MIERKRFEDNVVNPSVFIRKSPKAVQNALVEHELKVKTRQKEENYLSKYLIYSFGSIGLIV